MSNEPLRMEAYYYGFTETGERAIDLVLSAVACAGKAFHHTDQWTEDAYERSEFGGKVPVDWIQNAANAAATKIRALREQSDRATLLELLAAEMKRNGATEREIQALEVLMDPTSTKAAP